MATPALQHRTSSSFWLGLLSVGLLCGGLGYLVGKTAPVAADPLVQALQEPMTIVEASAFVDNAVEQKPDISAQQLAQTLAKMLGWI